MSNETGRSMIEMLGVLAIVGVLSAGGIAGYSKAIEKSRINKAVEQITVVSTHLSAIGSNGGNYAGMSNKTAIKLKAVLSEMNTTGTTLINPFGGEITIGSANLLNGSGNDQAYTIIYKGLNKPVCVALATNDWGSSKSSSFIGLSIGSESNISSGMEKLYLKCTGDNSAPIAACNSGTTLKTPLSVAAASAACAGCRSGSLCSIAFKYY